MKKQDRDLIIEAFNALRDAPAHYYVRMFPDTLARRITKTHYAVLEPFLKAQYEIAFQLDGGVELSTDGHIFRGCCRPDSKDGFAYVVISDARLCLLRCLLQIAINQKASYERITGHEFDGRTEWERRYERAAEHL